MFTRFDLEDIACQRKAYIGGYLIEHAVGKAFDEIFAAGKITKIAFNDFRLNIETDSAVAFYHSFTTDGSKVVTSDGELIRIHSSTEGVCFTIVPHTRKGRSSNEPAVRV
jgi:hypothetical protein